MEDKKLEQQRKYNKKNYEKRKNDVMTCDICKRDYKYGNEWHHKHSRYHLIMEENRKTVDTYKSELEEIKKSLERVSME